MHALRQQCFNAVTADDGRNKTLIESQERGVVRCCNRHEIGIGDLLMAEERFESGPYAGESWENVAIQMTFIGREPP